MRSCRVWSRRHGVRWMLWLIRSFQRRNESNLTPHSVSADTKWSHNRTQIRRRQHSLGLTRASVQVVAATRSLVLQCLSEQQRRRKFTDCITLRGVASTSWWRVSEQCFTSPPTQYRLYGRRFLQVKRPNQQYQSTEGDATKYKENN